MLLDKASEKTLDRLLTEALSSDHSSRIVFCSDYASQVTVMYRELNGYSHITGSADVERRNNWLRNATHEGHSMGLASIDGPM